MKKNNKKSILKYKQQLGIALMVVTFAGIITISLHAQAKPAHTFKLPSTAKALSDTVFDLGTKVDPATGQQVQGYAFILPKRSAVKPGGTQTTTTTSTCYALLSSGMKWKSIEPWLVDPTNSRGLDGTSVYNRIAANLQSWETAAQSDIFGSGTISSSLSAETAGSPDGRNEVMFGNIDEPGVIAVTITWGYYSGPTKNRVIIEWDQIYNDYAFDWSMSGESNKMDFNNIATHEIGHAAGLGHPSNTCTEETMYAYATNGETKKATLEAGDIVGINKLY